MAHYIIYRPWGGTKNPCPCFMAKLLLFCLAWLFFFFCIFSLLWLNLFLETQEAKLFYQQETRDMEENWGMFPGKPQRVLLSFSILFSSNGTLLTDASYINHNIKKKKKKVTIFIFKKISIHLDSLYHFNVCDVIMIFDGIFSSFLYFCFVIQLFSLSTQFSHWMKEQTDIIKCTPRVILYARYS